MTRLNDIINELDGGDPASLVNPPTGSDSSLSDVIDTQQAASPAPSDDDDIADSAEGSVRNEQEPGETQTAFNFRQNLQERLGVDTSDFSSDEDAFEAYTSALAQASEILNDEGYQEYLKSKEQGSTEKLPAASAPQEEKSAVEPAEPPKKTSDIFASTEVSSEAQLFAQQGLIVRGEDGIWEAKNPHLKPFADEYNKHDTAIRANVLKFSRNPSAFIREILEQQKPAEQEKPNKEIQILKSEIEALKAAIEARQKAEQQDVLQKWRSTAPLRDSENKLTPYAKQYMQWEKEVRELMPSASDVDVHKRVLRHLELAGVKAESSSDGKSSQKQKEPFAAKAQRRSSATNGNGTNRLQEYAGKVPTSAPSALTGKAGLPDLSKTIAQIQSELTD